MSNPSILLLIDSLHCGGAQRQLCYLARGLKELGWPTAVCIYHPEYQFFRPYLSEHGIEVIDLKKSPAWSLPFRLAKLGDRLGTDWLVSFSASANNVALSSKLFGSNFRVCCGERSCSRALHLTATERRRRILYRLANLIVANSQFQADVVRRSLPSVANRVHTIANCVGDSFLNSDRMSKPRSDTTVFVSVGQINQGKNLHGLIDAIEKVRRQTKKTLIIRWAGRVGENAEHYFTEQQSRIRTLGLETCFEFPGPVDDIPGFLRSGEALIHPSLFEGCPNAVCEALAVGLPVLTGNVADGHILVDDVRGLLFDPTNAESIAKSIIVFLNLSGKSRESMQTEARHFAVAEFAISTMARRYAKLLKGSPE